MKRFGSALAAPILPALILFVMTAKPARLYAESGPSPVPSTTCASLQQAPCEGKAAGDACSSAGGKAGTCKATACKKEDGTGTSVLTCVVSLSTQPTQGNTVPEEDEQEAGGPTTRTTTESCAVGSAPGAALGGACASQGLLAFAFAFARRARRR